MDEPSAERSAPYRLGEFELGRGGMGVVYEAVQTSLGRQVALKVPGPGTFPGLPRRPGVEATTIACRLPGTVGPGGRSSASRTIDEENALGLLAPVSGNDALQEGADHRWQLATSPRSPWAGP